MNSLKQLQYQVSYYHSSYIKCSMKTFSSNSNSFRKGTDNIASNIQLNQLFNLRITHSPHFKQSPTFSSLSDLTQPSETVEVL